MARNALSLLFVLFATLFAIARGSAVPEVQQRDANLPARVPYVFPAPGTSVIADAIRARRGNGTLLALDGALLNSPLVAQGWNQFFTVIRENLTIPGEMRELLVSFIFSFPFFLSPKKLQILRTAVINNAAYQWDQHEPVGRAEGLTSSQLQVVRFAPEGACSLSDQRILGDSLAAALAFADALATTVSVPNHVYQNLARFLTPQQMVEAVSTAGSYAFVSRFLMALNVNGEMNEDVPVPE
ncbi:4-carboxymuconolactone decarboxylase [Mycena epipterygia]|nr:4-carboxymuconolactone decarboxylase [Mycena epipterygia]